MSAPANINVQITANQAILLISGDWLANPCSTATTTLIAQLAQHKPQQLKLQAEDLIAWDSRLPSYLLKLLDYCRSQNIIVDTSTLPDGVQSLLKLAYAVPERDGIRRKTKRQSLLTMFGNWQLRFASEAMSLLAFIGQTLLALQALMRGKARFRTVDMLICIEDAGPSALPIVTLISLLVGLILAFVGALQLAKFGAQIYIADLVALGTVREMGVLMTAVIMSGRTGAAYAAQLGTMNVNSEIDALRTMGISPQEFLVLPRMIALVIMMPLLCLYANLMGIVGGAIISTNIFDVSLSQYYNELHKVVHLHDFAVGLFKSVVFALLIATAGCMRGMQCGRSASAVGDAATAAVVDSIVYIVLADSIITLICNQLRI